jgi:acetoin utilization protein AcuB
VRLEEVMNVDVRTADPNESAEAAWTRMRLGRFHHLVVMEDSRVVGVISDRDLGGAKGASRRKLYTVGDLMTLNVVTARPTTTLRQAANLLRGRSIGCLPILEGSKLVGIITVTDILDLLGRGVLRPPTGGNRWKRAYRQSRWPRPPAEPARH